MRRAFWVEDQTGRAQWEPPYQGQGYYDGSRSVPPPAPQGGYYAPPPGPPPAGYDQRGYGGGGGYQQPQTVVVEEKKSSNAGKYLAAGAAGLALGGIAGAFIEHERGEFETRDSTIK